MQFNDLQNMSARTPVLPPTEEAIALAVARLSSAELVAFPTETVYGVGADASNPQAVVKLFTLKGRPADHPVIVHLAMTAPLDRWAAIVPDDARRLLAQFAPGALTLILRKSKYVPEVVTGGQDTVGLRFPSHPVSRRLLEAFGGGIAAPSANRFGRVSPTTAAHVADEFGDRLPLILDGGPCAVGIESTIVDLSQGMAVLLRPGGVSAALLAEALGYMPKQRTANSPRVSGALPSHYSPATSTFLVPPSALAIAAHEAARAAKPVGVLARSATRPADFRGLWRQAPFGAEGYARTLYAELRLLDAAGLDVLLVEAPPEDTQWDAVNDRLRRATHSVVNREANSAPHQP